MSKYNVIELKIRDGQLIDFGQKSEAEKNALRNQNAIYVYRGTKSQKIYVGQTKNFEKRHKQHYSGVEEKFLNADFDEVIVGFSREFNRSVLDDVESKLITYFSADKQHKLKTMVDFNHSDVVLNRTRGNNVNDYIGREKVSSEIILPLWENIFYEKGWVENKTIDELRTKELVKYSPVKVLTDEQAKLIDEIVHNPQKNYVINGDAGTGKTVLLTHLVASMLIERKSAKIGVVVQPNWEKTGVDIFKTYGMDNGRLSILTSTKLITTRENYDVIIVDESHKMSRRYGKQHPSFNAVYKISEFENCQSHLEILQHLGKQIVLMYDVLQGIRPANITRNMFQNLTKKYEKKFLSTQFRIQTPKGKSYTSDDYINGIKYLLYKDTDLLDSTLTNYDPHFNRDVFRDNDIDAYFGYVTENPLHNLTEWIERDKNFNPEHINRILAGLVEAWKQSEGKNPSIIHWQEGNMKRRWNSTQENWINSKEEDAEEQIGSVFAVQGIDLNKVGVLIGKDLQVNSKGQLFADSNNFFNTNGTFTVEEMKKEENKLEFTLFVLNIYYVLLTRGIDGIRVGFWKNDAFRKYMEETLEIKENLPSLE